MLNIKTKKAMTGQLGLLIIILISAIVIFLFITKYTAKTTFEQSITSCRLSVIAQSATEVFPSVSGKKSPFDINCDKRYVTFYNNKAELGLSLENMKSLPIYLEGKKVTKFNTLNEFVVNQVVAEELRVCKFQFADGKMDVFGNDDNNFWGFGKKICYVCSEINFDNKIKPQVFKNLVSYTKNTKFDNNISYYEYLREISRAGNNIWTQPEVTPSTIGEMLGEKTKFVELELDTSKKYLVFFEMYSPSTITVLQWEKPQYVWIMPAEDISTYCDMQAS
jgi:hypothetical protein